MIFFAKKNGSFVKAFQPETITSIDQIASLPFESEKYYPLERAYSIDVLSTKKILDRYGWYVHQLKEVLPLSREEFDDIVLPVIIQFANYAHLLPASQANHHRGQGGLLIHSFESAIAAVKHVDTIQLPRKSYEVFYNNKARWKVAAAIMMLCHDLGKVEDMEIHRIDGIRWMPERESLMTFVDGTRDFRVFWKRERQYQTHQLASIRLSRFLLTKSLIDYLVAYSSVEILNAIDEAIVFQRNVLAHTLKYAEQVSIEKYGEMHRDYYPSIKSPQAALAYTLLSCAIYNYSFGEWTINQENSEILVDKSGMYLKVCTRVAREIGDRAKLMGYKGIPFDLDAMIRVLKEGGETVPAYEEVQYFDIRIKGQSDYQKYLKVNPSGELHLFAASSSVELEFKTTEPQHVLTPEESALPATSKDEPESSLETLSESDLWQTLEAPMDEKNEIIFLNKLINTLAEQLQQGSGTLIENLTTNSNVKTSGSVGLERVLARHHISTITLQYHFQLNKSRGTFALNANRHLLTFRTQ